MHKNWTSLKFLSFGKDVWTGLILEASDWTDVVFVLCLDRNHSSRNSKPFTPSSRLLSIVVVL